MYILHRVGASRCPPTQSGCNQGCKHVARDDRKPSELDCEDRELPKTEALTNVLDDMLDNGSNMRTSGDKVA